MRGVPAHRIGVPGPEHGDLVAPAVVPNGNVGVDVARAGGRVPQHIVCAAPARRRDRLLRGSRRRASERRDDEEHEAKTHKRTREDATKDVTL